ncbi:hypothetical protein [Homoserinimonas hongtaonis]|uniref:hypothetical protein n=1 Tax=Homoserinimonas hongtaonis TaxID=2079791 RepID=UPI000D39E77D|nr:hypothetical protein [Salinibacterium hongtaonis]AWB88754.1 hypothetical protein C2138_03600 [Salinibacterium hongtaonis]
MTTTPSPDFATLRLPSEPPSYGADTRPPAPPWLITATPGADELATAFEKAKTEAQKAIQNERKTTDAFRAASNPNSGEWEPNIDVEYDRWRQLKAKKGDATARVRSASQPVKRTWHALRDHLADSAEARAEANRVAAERHAELVAAIDALDAAIITFGDVDRLVPTKYARQSGALLYTLGADLAKASREFRALVAPKRWTRVSA